MKNGMNIFLLIISLYASIHLLTTKSIDIDKVYVINLDQHEDKYLTIKKDLDSLSNQISYTRFSALDGNNIKFINTTDNTIITGEQIIHNKTLLKGEFEVVCSGKFNVGFEEIILHQSEYNPELLKNIGKICSNRKIWQEIVNNNYSSALITNDNIKFIPEFEQYLFNALHNVPNDTDLLYLGETTNSKNFIANNINQYWVKKSLNKSSAKTYIVTQLGAKKLLKSSGKYLSHYQTIDLLINKLIEDSVLNAYHSNPQLSFKTE